MKKILKLTRNHLPSLALRMPSINERVALTGALSLIWIVGYKYFFVSMSPLFPKAAETGEVMFGLLTSIIASCIFYYFVVYLEQQKMARLVYPLLNRRLKTFGVGLYQIKSDLYQTKGQRPPGKLPAQSEFTLICENIILTSKPPRIKDNAPVVVADWFEYFNYYFKSDEFLLKQLYAHINLLTPEIISELDQISYSEFQRALDSYRSGIYDKLDGASGPFLSYLQSLEKLSEIELKI